MIYLFIKIVFKTLNPRVPVKTNAWYVYIFVIIISKHNLKFNYYDNIPNYKIYK